LKRFQFQWFDDNPSWKIWVKDVPNDSTKFFCQAYQTSLVCGLSEIKKYSLRENHLKNIIRCTSCELHDSFLSRGSGCRHDSRIYARESNVNLVIILRPFVLDSFVLSGELIKVA